MERGWSMMAWEVKREEAINGGDGRDDGEGKGERWTIVVNLKSLRFPRERKLVGEDWIGVNSQHSTSTSFFTESKFRSRSLSPPPNQNDGGNIVAQVTISKPYVAEAVAFFLWLTI
ncbi:hypothetical protein K1719_023431 [Acacia pycnantha]|nr:hypothetical protein K1719_023431 [Acacia pycnantha]